MSDLNIRIVLYDDDELVFDRQDIHVREDSDEAISDQIIEALKTWTLKPGDTIRIMELS